METLPQTLVSLWQGKQPLWIAFWVYGHGVYGLLLGAFIVMYKYSFSMVSGTPTDSTLGKIVVFLSRGVNIVDWSFIAIATVFFSVAIWRSAPNATLPAVGFLARAYIAWFWLFVFLGAILLIKGAR